MYVTATKASNPTNTLRPWRNEHCARNRQGKGDRRSRRRLNILARVQAIKEHLSKALLPSKVLTLHPAGVHQIHWEGGVPTDMFLLTFFFVAETKKTSGGVGDFPDKKNVCQTKKTSGRRKKRLADEKNVWTTSKKHRSHPKPMKNQDLGLKN